MLPVTELDKMILRVQDYPSPGVLFQDITPLLANSDGFQSLIHHMCLPFRKLAISHVIGIEARGFLLASAIASQLHAGLVPARKVGKLPRETISETYELEYGNAAVEIHADALPAAARVLIVDDVLATGGTLEAVVKIIRQMKVEIVGISVISEILPLKGRSKLTGIPIYPLIS